MSVRLGNILPAVVSAPLLLTVCAACAGQEVGAFPADSPALAPAASDKAAAGPCVPGRPDNAPSPTAAPVPATSSRIPPAFAETGDETAGIPAPGTQGRAQSAMAESADPSARARALETMPLSEDAEHCIGRCVGGLSDPSPEVRDASAKCASETAPEDLFAYMMRTMAWGAPEDVRKLDAALPRLAGRVDSLLAGTLDTEMEAPRHRRAAAYCLGRMGAVSAAAALARHAWDNEPELAATCALALGMLRWPGAHPDLVALLRHPDMEVRLTALRALADLNTPRGWRTVADAAAGRLEQPARVRKEAVRLLGLLPPGDAIPTLLDVMRADKTMAQEAARVLKQITGLNYGPDPEAWIQGLQETPPEPAPNNAGGVPWENRQTTDSATSETPAAPSPGAKTPKGRRK